jgi:hypothetical protein
MKVFPNLGVRTKPLFHPQTKLNLFAQFFEHIDRSVFKKLVIQHSSDKYSKSIITWTADTVSQLYRASWDVEVFCKHLKLEKLRKCLRIQMWCSLSGMLLLRYLESRAKYPWHRSNLITFLRLNLCTKISLEKWIHQPFEINPQPLPELRLF